MDNGQIESCLVEVRVLVAFAHVLPTKAARKNPLKWRPGRSLILEDAQDSQHF
jgi:hypothetical protein